jgi:hypothetical protein
VRFFRDGLEIESTGPPKVLVREGHVCEVFEREADGPLWFVTLENGFFCAHGDSFYDAVAAAKEKQNPGAAKTEAVSRVRETKRVNLRDFCLVTGACRAGATAWAKDEGVSIKGDFRVDEVLKMLSKSSSRQWGERFREELGEPNERRD